MSLIKASGRTFVEELATNPQVNLMVVCERLGAPFNDGEAEISLAAKVAEKLYDRPQLVTKMLQQEAIEFLLQCWEMEGESLITQMYLRELEQLHFLGFLSYEDDTIYINMEAKTNFSFRLRVIGHRLRWKNIQDLRIFYLECYFYMVFWIFMNVVRSSEIT